MPLANKLPHVLEDLIGPCCRALHDHQTHAAAIKDTITYNEALARDVKAVLQEVYNQGYVLERGPDQITLLFSRIKKEAAA